MRGGLLNERVTFQQRSVTRDAFGAEVVTWADFATVWANVSEQHAMEQVAAAERVQTRVVQVKTRWVAGVTGTMRIKLDTVNRVLQIVSMAELRKRLGYTFVCEEYSV